MRLPLRARVLLMVTAINLLVFGGGFWYASRELESRLRQDYARALAEYSRVLFERLQSSVSPQGELQVADILRWPLWEYFDDALLVHKNLGTDARGAIAPRGAWINPKGRLQRPAGFDEQSVLRDVARAIQTGETIPSAGGTVIPILDQHGAVWGGCWFALAPFQSPVSPVRFLLPGFLISTLLLTLATSWILRRSVLDPVARLSRAAERVAQGERGARVGRPFPGGEIGGLMRSFDAMAAEVEGASARLEREVLLRSEEARTAVAAAMTQRRLAAMGELAAGIAHEINNPLGGLINAAEALEGGRLSPEQRAQYLQLVRSGLERIRRTVGQLLRFTPRAAAPVSVALAEPVLDAIALVQHRADALAVEIAVLGADGVRGSAALQGWRRLPRVRGEPHELGQAVLNLLVNALDALESRGRGGRIEVALERRAEALALSVADDGPGVAPADLPRVFDLFFTTKQVGKGSGLGLSIVHRIVAAHGGTIRLDSRPGGGLSVEIVLPAEGGAAH
jgi:signal transduction histidine kinase